MREALSGLTVRGRAFLAAGVTAVVCAVLLGQPTLTRVGVLIAALPLLTALTLGRSRYRLALVRSVGPQTVTAGQPATVQLTMTNEGRTPSGVLMLEDHVPYVLGTRPRFGLDGIGHGWRRHATYQVRSDVRGRYEIGPMSVRVSDPFGLVELGRSFSTRSTLVVSPKVVPLPGRVTPASWLGDGEGRARVAAAAGEDDPAPRPYRDGDELRRVHWRSTARYGELMVRREEQQWRNHAVLLLDTRRSAHAGSGASSSFEAAVSAAASIGVHLAMQGFAGQLVTDTGAVSDGGAFEDVLLDTLAVVRASGGSDLVPGLTAATPTASGLFIVVAGRMSAAQARKLASSHRAGTPALALLLAVSSWEIGPQAAGEDGTEDATSVLTAAGWRVATLRADTPLAVAWQRLHQVPITPTAAAGRYAPEVTR